MRVMGWVVLAIALAWSAWQSDIAPLVVPAALAKLRRNR